MNKKQKLLKLINLKEPFLARPCDLLNLDYLNILRLFNSIDHDSILYHEQSKTINAIKITLAKKDSLLYQYTKETYPKVQALDISKIKNNDLDDFLESNRKHINTSDWYQFFKSFNVDFNNHIHNYHKEKDRKDTDNNYIYPKILETSYNSQYFDFFIILICCSIVTIEIVNEIKYPSKNINIPLQISQLLSLIERFSALEAAHLPVVSSKRYKEYDNRKKGGNSNYQLKNQEDKKLWQEMADEIYSTKQSENPYFKVTKLFIAKKISKELNYKEQPESGYSINYIRQNIKKPKKKLL